MSISTNFMRHFIYSRQNIYYLKSIIFPAFPRLTKSNILLDIQRFYLIILTKILAFLLVSFSFELYVTDQLGERRVVPDNG